MKHQFSIKSILLTTAAVAIACAGIQTYHALPRNDSAIQLNWELWHFSSSSPLWAPVAFLAYSIGRRSITVWTVLVFAVAEIIAVSCAYFFAPILKM